MSVATEPRRAPHADDPLAHCENCDSPLRDDQEWCLECGAARTLIHRPPDWRIAAAIVGTVVVLVIAGFAIALINLSANSNRTAATVATSATTTSTTAATTTAASARPTHAAASAFPDWPVGLPGWTVVLFTGTGRPTAVIAARQMTKAGLHVGILSTSQHPSTNMRPGHFAVYTGRYPTAAAAQTRTSALDHRGFRARVRLVGRPGSP